MNLPIINLKINDKWQIEENCVQDDKDIRFSIEFYRDGITGEYIYYFHSFDGNIPNYVFDKVRSRLNKLGYKHY